MTSGPTVRTEPVPARARLGVVGWPVAHSRSPAMQTAALRAVGLTGWRYQLMPVPPALAAETLGALGGAGVLGVIVTIPHKAVALAVADTATERARAIGAANTLLYRDGAIHADNTDGPALAEALPAATASALVLGAGGTARAAVWALRDRGVEEIAIWNRTPQRAEALAAELGVSARSTPAPADVLINCSAAGLDGEDPFPTLPVGRDGLGDFATVVDFVYADGGSRLLDAARARGCATVDGLQLLVGQGALSFTAFTGDPAPREVMRAALRAG